MESPGPLTVGATTCAFHPRQVARDRCASCERVLCAECLAVNPRCNACLAGEPGGAPLPRLTNKPSKVKLAETFGLMYPLVCGWWGWELVTAEDMPMCCASLELFLVFTPILLLFGARTRRHWAREGLILFHIIGVSLAGLALGMNVLLLGMEDFVTPSMMWPAVVMFAASLWTTFYLFGTEARAWYQAPPSP